MTVLRSAFFSNRGAHSVFTIQEIFVCGKVSFKKWTAGNAWTISPSELGLTTSTDEGVIFRTRGDQRAWEEVLPPGFSPGFSANHSEDDAIESGAFLGQTRRRRLASLRLLAVRRC